MQVLSTTRQSTCCSSLSLTKKHKNQGVHFGIIQILQDKRTSCFSSLSFFKKKKLVLGGISKAAADALRYALANSHNSVIWAIYERFVHHQSHLCAEAAAQMADCRTRQSVAARKRKMLPVQKDGNLRKAEGNANGLLVIV